MMRTSALFGGALLALAAVTTLAQAATVSGVYNTGVDDAGNKLAIGATDTHYRLSISGTGSVYTNVNYAKADDAQFISPMTSGAGPSQTYSTTFDLTGYNVASAALSGFVAGDDQATVFLNGTEIAFTGNPGYGRVTAFTTSAHFVAGLNTLSFAVVDTGGQPTGLLVSRLMVTAIATPGPIAGAGIPAALGLLGAWSLRRRRNARRA